MQLSKLMCAAALSTAVVLPSYANTTYNLGTVPVHGEASTGPVKVAKGKFTDTIDFTISSGGAGSAQYDNFFVKFGNSVISNITNAKLSLTGPSGFSYSPSSVTSGGLIPLSFVAGSYVAKLSGIGTGTKGGSYAFTIASAVPDAAGWATMLAGMSLAGVFAQRRLKKVDAAS